VNSYLRSALDAIDREAGTLPIEVFLRPVEGKWSIAEILEHLALAFRANAAAIEKVLVSGELRTRQPRVRQTLGRVLVLDLGYFPRVHAPDVTRPSGIAPERSLETIREALLRLDSALSGAVWRGRSGSESPLLRGSDRPPMAKVSLAPYHPPHAPSPRSGRFWGQSLKIAVGGFEPRARFKL
jgi:hypothetical protein